MMHNDEGSRATAMLGDGAARCGLCGGAGRPGRELISPCRCTGPRQWVHRQCLDRERHAATQERPFLFTECGECHFQYIVQRRARDLNELADAHQRHQQRLRRATWWVVKAVLGLLAAVLLVVAALACVLKLLDPQGLLVGWWKISGQACGAVGEVCCSSGTVSWCTDGECKSGTVSWYKICKAGDAPEDDFWHAVKEQKTTYMLFSSVLLLFLTGFVGSAAGLIHILVDACRACCGCLCGRSTAAEAAAPPPRPAGPRGRRYCPIIVGDCCEGCRAAGCDEAGPLIVIVFLVVGSAMAFKEKQLLLMLLSVATVSILVMGIAIVKTGIWEFAKKVFEVYHQKQLRDLSAEYEVMDLSDLRWADRSARRSEEDRQRLLLDLQAQYALEDTSAFSRRHPSVADIETATVDREGAAPLAVEPASTVSAGLNLFD